MKKILTALLLTFFTVAISNISALAGEKGLNQSIIKPTTNYSIPSVNSMKFGGGLLFGFRLMPTFTHLNYTDNSNGTVTASAKMGFGIGALLGVNLNDHVGLQLEG